MPVYITPQKVKMRQLNGNNSDQFYGLDVVAAEATAEQVAAINSAANTATSNINSAANTATTTINNVTNTAITNINNTANTATTNLNTAATNANTAANNLNSQVQAIATAIVEAEGNGTDPTLTLSNVAADAKATGDAIGDLKSAIKEDKPNILDPEKIIKDEMFNASNEVYTNTSYEYIDYTSVTEGHKYSLAEVKNDDVNTGITMAMVLAVKSSDSSYVRLYPTTDGSATYFTITSGYDTVRICLKYSELTDPSATLMLYDCTDGYTDKIYEYGEAKERELVNSNYVKQDEADAAKRVTAIDDFEEWKWTVDNFQRMTGETVTTGYTAIGKDSVAIIDDVDEHTKKIIKDSNVSGRQILMKTLNKRQCVCFAGDNAVLVFNIKDIYNFYYLIPGYTYNSETDETELKYQLYKRINNVGTYVSQLSAHKVYNISRSKWFTSVVLSETSVKIYDNYEYVGEITSDAVFDGTVGMVFGLYGDESYDLFGTGDLTGKTHCLGLNNVERYINNKSDESVNIEQDGAIKLLVDMAKGYADKNAPNYRSMIGFRLIPYDHSYCKFSMDFKLDETLEGAGNFLILQWHDNAMHTYNLEFGVSPFISVIVMNNNGAQKVQLNVRGANWFISSNLGCNIEIIDLCNFDTDWHHIEIEAIISYNIDAYPYLRCTFDGETVCSKNTMLGYYGQKGYNISAGIYGWQVNGTDWEAPNAEGKPFMTIRNIRYQY